LSERILFIISPQHIDWFFLIQNYVIKLFFGGYCSVSDFFKSTQFDFYSTTHIYGPFIVFKFFNSFKSSIWLVFCRYNHIFHSYISWFSGFPSIASAIQTSTQASATSSSVQAGISPITQIYHSNRPGHPTSQSQSTGFHPLIGTRLNLPATTIANQARLALANNTLPCQVSLPVWCCCQAIVQQAPALSRSAPKISINDCTIKDASGIESVHIVARIFPLLVCYHILITSPLTKFYLVWSKTKVFGLSESSWLSWCLAYSTKGAPESEKNTWCWFFC